MLGAEDWVRLEADLECIYPHFNLLLHGHLERMKLFPFILILSMISPAAGYCEDTLKPVVPREYSAGNKAAGLEEFTDYDYAWDQFKHRGRMIWECRGLQSGRFVPPELCMNKQMVDTHWPDKKIPDHWKP